MSEKSATPDPQATAGFLGDLIKQGRLTWRLFKDGRVPGWVKLIPILGLLYLLSPIDLIPDLVLPGLGEVDDIVLLLIAAKMFVDLSPPTIVREHLDRLSGARREPRSADAPADGPTIDAPYRVLDEAESRQRRTE